MDRIATVQSTKVRVNVIAVEVHHVRRDLTSKMNRIRSMSVTWVGRKPMKHQKIQR